MDGPSEGGPLRHVVLRPASTMFACDRNLNTLYPLFNVFGVFGLEHVRLVACKYLEGGRDASRSVPQGFHRLNVADGLLLDSKIEKRYNFKFTTTQKNWFDRDIQIF